jgi:hypothetical protein
MPEDVRDEAQRLVAAALAAAQFAFRNPGAAKWLAEIFRPAGPSQVPAHERALGQMATGTAECCVCPVCRVIAAVRDPSPEFAAGVASGASDLAAGLTSILRAFGGKTPPPRTPRDAGPTWRAATGDDEDWPVPEPTGDDDPWHAATTAPAPAPKES